MARTKQIASKSTGGRAPRKQLASKCARMSPERLMRLRPVLVNDIAQVWREGVSKRGDESGRYRVELVSEVDGRKVCNLTLDDFLYVFGKQITTVVDSGEWERLTLARAMRLGLTESEDDRRDYGGATEFAWSIGKIWLSKGLDGEIKGRYYATAVEEPGKWAVDLYTLEIRLINQEEGDDVPMFHEAKDGVYTHGSESRIAALGEIDEWCSENPGRRLEMTSAKSREPSVNAGMHQDTRHSLGFRDASDRCVLAATLHGLMLVRSKEEAIAFCDLQEARIALLKAKNGFRPRIRGFRDMQKVCNGEKAGIGLFHVRNGDGDLIEPSCRFFMRSSRRGVFVLTVRANDDFRHAICIDTRGDPGTIYDSAEKFPLLLSVEAIKLCVGDNREFTMIEDCREVKKVVERDPNKKKSRRGTSSSDKKKKKKQAAAVDEAAGNA